MHNLSQGVGGGLIDVHLSPVKKRGMLEHPEKNGGKTMIWVNYNISLT